MNVTQEDINNGIRNNGNNCPLALAVKREYPGYNNIYVKDSLLFIDHPENPSISGYFLLDDVCFKFEKDFDDGLSVEPIEIIFLGSENARKINK